MSIKTYEQYNDPLTIVFRKGTPDDPYKERIDSLPVINNQITLLEIPSEFHRVSIAGYTEINQDIFRVKKSLQSNEFIVNYSNGNIQFNPSEEGKTILCQYLGKGFILYPASRIYALVSKKPDIVKTLQEIIDEATVRLSEVQAATRKAYETIQLAEEATTNANIATDNAYAAINAAEDATNKALDAYENTRLVYMPFVQEPEDIATTYPNPEIGWTTQVFTTGIRYRFNGVEWVPIDMFGGSIPKANEHIDGLLSKEDFERLVHIDEQTYDRRVIVIYLPSISASGKQGVTVRFPFNGRIIGIEGICSSPGTTDTEISIEKSTDMVEWEPILSRNLIIREQANFDDGGKVVENDVVNANDLFRVDVIQQGVFIQNITIEIEIETIKD